MRDRIPPPAADGHAMEVTPDTDEAPLPEPGRDVWIEGTEHGPLPVSVLEHATGGLLGLEPPRLDGVPVRLDEGRRIRVDYRLQGVPCALQAETVAPGACSAGPAADQTPRPDHAIPAQKRLPVSGTP